MQPKGRDVDLTARGAIVQLALGCLVEAGVNPHQLSAETVFASRWAE